MTATPKQLNQSYDHDNDQLHVPVLLQHVLTYLNPQAGESYLDLTAGYGGHASRILEHTHSPDKAVLVDRDQNAVRVLEATFAPFNEVQGITIIQTDFLTASKTLRAEGKQFDMILADLGVSSPHLNLADRGFAISIDGPLDMRMDQNQSLTAADIVNTYSADQLTDILQRYGEEPKSRAIARLIVQNRPPDGYRTTTQLAQIAARAWPGHSKVHPATRTFQALRIAVNDELRLVEESLPLWVDLLAPGGRLVVISFHSLEDRIVKKGLAEVSDGGGDRYDAQLRLLTKRPVVAEPDELVFNPRARSAKLRAAVRLTI